MSERDERVPYVGVPRDSGGEGRNARHITRRTSQLPISSKVLYRIDHYSSIPGAAVSVLAVLLVLFALGAILGFPNGWVSGFEVSVSAVTLLMVFTIQHTQGREQSATQRKLDELLRALPGAAESLMMLEEAPEEILLKVEVEQRDARTDLLEGSADGRLIVVDGSSSESGPGSGKP